MFTGIIESMGTVIDRASEEGNVIFRVQSSISSQLRIDQSLAHNGVCLTVVAQEQDWHEVVAIQETLDRSALNLLQPGSLVNLERAMKLADRLDGHLVQGHVDAIAEVTEIADQGGSHLYTFRCDHPDTDQLVVDKGSICINGVSLTLIKPTNQTFQVAIIPYTFEYTNFKSLTVADLVNIEFDILGKYVAKQLSMVRHPGVP